MDVTKAAKGTIFVFLATFIGLGINYFYGIMVARFMGASTFGQFSLGLTIFNILSLLSVFGMDHAVLKYMPECKKSELLSERNLIKSVLIVGCVVSLFFGVNLFFSAEYLAVNSFEDPGLGFVFKMFSIAVPAYALTAIMISILQSKHNVYWRILVKYFSEPIIKITVTFILFSIGYGISAALIGFLLALWLSALLCYVGIKRHFPVVINKSNNSGNVKDTT